MHWSFDHTEGNAYPAEGSMPGVELAAASPRTARVEDNKVPGKYGAGVTFRKFENELMTKHPGIGGDRPRTVACWIKVKKAPRERTIRTNIVGWGDRDVMLYNRQRWQLAVMGDGDGASNLTVVGAGAHRTNSKLENGEWYHVAAVWDPGAKPPETGVMRVYINGQEQKLGVYQKGVWPNTKVGQEALPIVIGATMTLENNNRSTFHGAIDELFIIEGAIGQDQVIQLMEENSMK
ncbi:LamG domain-containing protein [Rubritalea halochordaticola]